MVSLKSVEQQLKRIRFDTHAWGRAEAKELPNILMPEEQIFECVNGMYEGGFALLVATNQRLLLVDKKPLKFLTVEDLRFDMINQIDYSHRLFGANISVSAGSKNLKFRSYNQERLRKLISHVQHRMTESKKEQTSQAETQQQHLEQINQQLQAYLLAQYQQQEELRQQLDSSEQKPIKPVATPDPVKPSPELSDYLLAKNLLKQYQDEHPEVESVAQPSPEQMLKTPDFPELHPETAPIKTENPQLSELYQEGMKEIFGSKQQSAPTAQRPLSDNTQALQTHHPVFPSLSHPLEINPLKIAYSKLPLALRNRAFTRASTGSVAKPAPSQQQSTTNPLTAR